MFKYLGFLALGILVSCSTPIDDAMSSAQANDPSVIFSGCGQGASNGYLFCRAKQDAPPVESIRLIFPRVLCDRPSCIVFQFARKDGSPGYAGSVPKGMNEVSVKVSDILGHGDKILASDEGEYRVGIRIYAKLGGEERSEVAFGIYRLQVLDKAYKTLACNDPNTAYSSRVNLKCSAQFSTKLRSALCGECQ